ncbi:ribosomal protein L7Ae family protein [Streptococcus sp. DD10]|uniref:YlxQ-related RNA-binding protein n=1 Tax=Streptococcus sp. DD10 TaxID=1777878 RepID=UPI00079421C1|nr:YlxQ-related RNA-binding protein [Streptococcus sp. DD10]KXT73870.1 ribosomal protein L7Ae family protein [Streptococcus sp. DD10]
MNNQQRLLNLLGLAQRAGKVISGEEQVIKAIQHQEVHIVFLAHDAASNLTKKVQDKSQTYQIEVSNLFSTQELSLAVGRNRKVLAISDAGFTKKMRSLM